jgi:hypothetical protein
MALMLRDASQRSRGGGRVCAPSCAAMLLSMRAGAPRIWPTKPTVILAERSQASTNQQLYEMTAGLPSLFPACSLQGMVQPTRAGRIERSRFCKATRSQTRRWSGRHIRTRRPSIPRGASPSCRPVCVRLPNKPRRPHSTLFFVRQSCAFDPRPRFPVTKVAPLVARHRGHFKRIVREELCVLGGRLTSIVAADAKSYDSRVT